MIPDLLDVKIRRFMYPGVSKTRSAVVVREVLILEDEGCILSKRPKRCTQSRGVTPH